jgi:hypothetical protein
MSAMIEHRPTIAALTALIARSPIAATRPAAHLPVGFDAVDAAILAWIAAEGRPTGRRLALM